MSYEYDGKEALNYFSLFVFVLIYIICIYYRGQA